MLGLVAGHHEHRRGLLAEECMRGAADEQPVEEPSVVQPHGDLYRFCGEEFVVLLPTMAHDDALAFSQNLRSAIASGLSRPDRTPLTISIGVATSVDDGTQFRNLLAEADIRLYAAKNNGRDQVHGRHGVSMESRSVSS